MTEPTSSAPGGGPAQALIDDLLRSLGDGSGDGVNRDRLAENVRREIQRRVAQETADLAAENSHLLRRLAEQARASAGQRAQDADLREAIDRLPAEVLILSRSGMVVQANAPALEYLGLTAAELRGAPARSLLHPQDVSRAARVLAGSRISGRAFELELRVRSAEGVYPWFQARGQPSRSLTGRVESWSIVLINIDDRRRDEDKLRARELGMRLLVESLHSIPALAIISNEYGEIVYANQQVLEYYDRSLEEVKRWPTSAHIVHPDDLDRANQVVAKALAAGVAVSDEYRLRRHDGVYRWFEGRYSPVRDAAGKIVNWFVLLLDIDERKNTEAQVRRNEAFLAEAQRLSGTGSFHWRTAAGEISCSDQLLRIFGFAPRALVTPEQLFSRVHPDDRSAADDLMARVHAGLDFEGQLRLVLPDGALRVLQVLARTVAGAEGAECFCAVQDVTQRWRAEEDLSKVRTELAHVGRMMSLGALTASIAHELNQPLTGIVTNAATSVRLLQADPPEVETARRASERLLRDANRAADVVTRLRELFAKQRPSTGLVDLNEAVREVMSLSASELARAGVVARQALDRGLPLVRGDKVQLQQVILNLVLNASDAMRQVEGGPRELVVSTVSLGAAWVRLLVRDTGIGIDPQDIEPLFQPFRTSKANGMGMGLSVSRSIVDVHGGRLWAEANDGPGATFFCDLPAAS